jgi:hypothetical protein
VGVYLVTLSALHGWPIAELSSAITAYYVLGAAVLFCFVGSLYERYGENRLARHGGTGSRRVLAADCRSALARLRLL